jgi:HlyD family secretion protein
LFMIGFRLLSVLILLPCFLSCKDKGNNIMTFTLGKADYEDRINVTGSVQAVSSVPVIAPRNQYGQMIVERIAEDGSFVHKGDTLCVLSVPQVESTYQDMLKSIQILEAELQKADAGHKMEISALEADKASAAARLKIATLDTLKLRYATKFQQELLRLEMKRAVIEKEKIDKKLINTIDISQGDIRQKQFRISQEKVRAQVLADQMNAMTIIAQRDGIVTRAESPRLSVMSTSGTGTFGGPVREGSVLMIDPTVLHFPDMSRMQISAEASESDFKRIEKGQKVIIHVDAAKKLLTTGIVNRKSLASTAAQRSSGSKVRAYEVIINIDSCHSKLKPGLSAMCEIVLMEAKDTLFVPTLAIYQRDSVNVVYVKHNKSFIPARIETGTSGDSYTIIASGLKGGETIALTEPPENLIKNDKSKEFRP